MTTPIISTPAGDISLKRLQEFPARMLAFLRGIGLNPQVQAQLEAFGYSAAVNSQGWSLLWDASGFSPTGAPASNPVSEAITALSDACSPLFHRVHAALLHNHPAQSDFVFQDVTAATGADAIIAMRLLLDRLDALDGAPDRVATRTEDHAALSTLTARGIDAVERKRLRGLLDQAMSGAVPVATPARVTKHIEALVALRAWYLDWSETAHAVLDKRGDLIKLGLAKRQKRAVGAAADAGAGAGAPATPPSPTAPGPSASPSPSGPGVTPAAPPSPHAPPTTTPAALLVNNGANGASSSAPLAH